MSLGSAICTGSASLFWRTRLSRYISPLVMRRIEWAILGLSGVVVLIHKVALVPVKADAIHQVVTFIIVGIDVFGIGHQPVLVFVGEADEHVSLLYAEKAPCDAFTSGEPSRVEILEFALVVLLTELVSVGPVMPVGNRLQPRGTGNSVNFAATPLTGEEEPKCAENSVGRSWPNAKCLFEE